MMNKQSIYREVVVIHFSTIFLVFVGFEVLIAMVMKSTIFWDVTPCSPLKVN
jgi:hypothetical protein